jgi:hypothetical protein
MRARLSVWVILAVALAAAFAFPGLQTLAVDATWRGSYFQNMNLEGQPALVRQDSAIAFDWGAGPPVSGPGWWGDNFSVRWERTDRFDTAVYIFAAASDDGVRMYVDGDLIIDEWTGRQGSWTVVERSMTAGEHRVVVEYFEETGRAAIQAGYYRKDGGGRPATATPGSASLTATPRVTRTPYPTATPYSGGISGQAVAEVEPPPIETGRMVEENSIKSFAWTGFPGPVLRSTGHAGQHSYVKNRSSKPTFEVQWLYRLDQPGYYDVYAYIPSGVRPTRSASYRVFSSGKLNPPVTINQAVNQDRWVKIGTYYFTNTEMSYVLLSNVTGEPSASTQVLLDAVMFVYSP